VRAIAVQPPSTPVAPGSVAVVGVDGRRRAYAWSLRRAGVAKPLARGRTSSPQLRVRVPAGGGLYELTARSRGRRHRAIPVARASGARSSSSCRS
jgi:hypothetical protein